MKNPKPINLQTSDRVRAQGWGAESRDADGHLISCYDTIGTGDDGIIDWVRECNKAGETVTFWPTDAS